MIYFKVTVNLYFQVSRHVKVMSEPSPYFQVTFASDCKSKIAPGMTYTFYVNFKPVAVKDYFHKIEIVSDVETFSIPVYGKQRSIYTFFDIMYCKISIIL